MSPETKQQAFYDFHFTSRRLNPPMVKLKEGYEGSTRLVTQFIFTVRTEFQSQATAFYKLYRKFFNLTYSQCIYLRSYNCITFVVLDGWFGVGC